MDYIDKKTGRFLKGHPSQRKGMSIVPLEGTKECSVCHKMFSYKRRCVSDIPMTCSKECRYKSCSIKQIKHVYKTCMACKKKFGRPYSIMYDSRRKDTRLYCSIKCRKSATIRYPIEVKRWANLLVYAKVQQGTLKKLPCEVCGELKTDAHHYKGYKKENWLDIKWLCKKHHGAEHTRLRKSGESLLL